MDWRNAADYSFDPPLRPVEWAWQFLRRNPEYAADYARFIATWRALEADYGAPPARDFFRWRQDPRAWRAESEMVGCSAEICPGEGDRVLIECWMGAKWDLAKFPLDPALVRPTPGLELDWRAQPVEVEAVGGPEDLASLGEEKMALVFDLSLPLAPQLDAARVRLVARARALEKAGRITRQVAAAAPTWTRWLRLLDGTAAGAAEATLAQVLKIEDVATALRQARAMCASGYRRILFMH